MSQGNKGIIHLLPVILLAGTLVVALFLISRIVLKTTSRIAATSVELKTAYKNPFDKETQYVNPFDPFKNPIVTAK